jgi:hypothetical protein
VILTRMAGVHQITLGQSEKGKETSSGLCDFPSSTCYLVRRAVVSMGVPSAHTHVGSLAFSDLVQPEPTTVYRSAEDCQVPPNAWRAARL